MHANRRYPFASDQPERAGEPTEKAGESRCYFDRRHPLASVAARHCDPSHSGRVGGGVACGRCWERAIRDDEKFAVEAELPRDLVRDPLLVDDLAVELACEGRRVPLSPVELRIAITRLLGEGQSLAEIQRRLHRDGAAISKVIATMDRASAAAAAGQGGEAA